jgi:hypothetical protein
MFPSHFLMFTPFLQFLLIIKDSVETPVKAAFSLKVFCLVERFASAAVYGRTMADVLAAAGNSAPKRLAAQIAGTLSLCGERDVQLDTARLFMRLLKAPEPLSDTQMLVWRLPFVWQGLRS